MSEIHVDRTESQPKSDLSEEELQRLIALCHDAKKHSYSPYSHFRVGVSLLTTDGSWYTGSNVENASYGLSICAERTAMCKAITEGHRSFRAIAVTSDLTEEYCSPCGACRQFLIEFGLDYAVFFVKPDGSFHATTVSKLLPDGFVPSHLQNSTLK